MGIRAGGDEAETLELRVMETSRAKLGPEHPSTLASINNLASTYRDKGRWEEAEKLLVQVVETSRTKLGPDHPDTLTSMGNLASTYGKQGRWAEAETLEVQGDGDFQIEARAEPSRHTDQYEQPSVDTLEPRPVVGGGDATRSSNGNQQD